MDKIIKPVPAVNAVIFNPMGQILLTKRSARVREAGKWCLPGGHLEGGEDWIAALQREVLEETGLVVVDQKLLGIYSDPSVTISAEKNAGGYFEQFVVVCFIVLDYTGTVNPNDEVDEWGWFSFDQIPAPILRSHPVRIGDARNFRGEVFVR